MYTRAYKCLVFVNAVYVLLYTDRFSGCKDGVTDTTRNGTVYGTAQTCIAGLDMGLFVRL